ncbi:winged helix-turn-helix domain-containing protein [Candidatus Woesearchaeota archaeon]|nr:winged helix-turn-helix domain-containing protein [Candidatus Woesearchaeota archaeon]
MPIDMLLKEGFSLEEKVLGGPLVLRYAGKDYILSYGFVAVFRKLVDKAGQVLSYEDLMQIYAQTKGKNPEDFSEDYIYKVMSRLRRLLPLDLRHRIETAAGQGYRYHRLKEFNLLDVIPLETPNLSQLENLMDYWRREDGFDSLNAYSPPTVDVLDGQLYLADGNHRAMLLALNGADTIMAEVRFIGPEDKTRRRIYAQKQRRMSEQGIVTVYDAAQRIPHPERFRFLDTSQPVYAD